MAKGVSGGAGPGSRLRKNHSQRLTLTVMASVVSPPISAEHIRLLPTDLMRGKGILHYSAVSEEE